MTFQFAAPGLLTLLMLLPLLAYVLHRKQARHQTAGLRFASVGLVRQQRTWRTTLRPLLTVGRLLAIALMIIGLARPQAGASQRDGARRRRGYRHCAGYFGQHGGTRF